MITSEKHKIYYHATTIWIPNFLEYNFKYVTLYFFDLNQGGSISFEVMNSLPRDQRPKRVAILVEGNADGKHLGDHWAAFAKKYGYEVVLRGSMAVRGRDFAPLIIKAKSLGVDTVLVFSNAEETATLVRQMKKLGSMKDILKMLPGMGSQMGDMGLDGGELNTMEAIICSMTARERTDPSVI